MLAYVCGKLFRLCASPSATSNMTMKSDNTLEQSNQGLPQPMGITLGTRFGQIHAQVLKVAPELVLQCCSLCEGPCIHNSWAHLRADTCRIAAEMPQREFRAPIACDGRAPDDAVSINIETACTDNYNLVSVGRSFERLCES